jgi:hypothetical protein
MPRLVLVAVAWMLAETAPRMRRPTLAPVAAIDGAAAKAAAVKSSVVMLWPAA